LPALVENNSSILDRDFKLFINSREFNLSTINLRLFDNLSFLLVHLFFSKSVSKVRPLLGSLVKLSISNCEKNFSSKKLSKIT